jgi:uncharacterized protein (TIGR02599 family)
MKTHQRPSGFTLVELIASAAVIVLLMLMLVQMSKSTATTWKNSLSKAEQFRESRRAFELVTRRLANATLNTYFDYKFQGDVDPASTPNAIPSGYRRQSDLRFRVLAMGGLAPDHGFHATHGVFFQSPAGFTDPTDRYWLDYYSAKTELAPVAKLDGMLNTFGYFLEVSDTAADMPTFLSKDAPPRYRSRLMEFREDSINLSVYKFPIRKPNLGRDDWFTTPLNKAGSARPVHAVAENVIAMVLLPRLSAMDEATRLADTKIPKANKLLSPYFDYDSTRSNNYAIPNLPAGSLPHQINPFNQLPPVVQVVMVALDELSANRLATEAKVARNLDLDVLLENLFQKAEQLESREGGKGDLALLEERLMDRKLKYRIFTSNVSLRGARWSAAEVD